MIKLKNISLSYHKPIFKNMNLEITTPGIYGIIGESGIGKSTILNILYGLELNYSGSYTFGETDVSNNTNIQSFYGSQIAFIHQDSKLISKLSAIENIQIASFDDITDEEIYALANKLNITKDTLNKKVKFLSGGEKQRVAILRGIINNPKVLLFDEPTSGLDKVNRQNFIDLIEPLKDLGIIVIIVSHDFVLREYIDNVYEINNYDIHLTKGESIKSEVNGVEGRKNKDLNKHIFKNLIASKVMVMMFLVISIISIFVTLTLISPVADIIEEAKFDYSNTYKETDILVTAGNEQLFNEEYITTIENIEGVESVEVYSATMNGDQYQQIQFTTNEEITTNNEDGFYDITKSEAYKYLPFKTATNVTVYAKNVSSYDDSVYYTEGEAPNTNDGIAITESFASALKVQQEWDTVIGQTIPLTCTEIETQEVRSCDKVITGVVKEYKYNPGPFYCQGSMENTICPIYVYEPTNIEDENVEYGSMNINLEEGANSEVVAKEISELGFYPNKAEDFYVSSAYDDALKAVLRKVIIFYVLAAIFIFIVTLNYFMNKRREYAIYLTLGYSKMQIFKNSLAEIFILYTLSYIIGAGMFILLGGTSLISMLWIICLYFILISFYILPIIYLLLGMSKRSINKNLK